MTAIVPYLSVRSGVFYYVRRVPLEVRHRSVEFGEIFKGQSSVRWSLRTKDRQLALSRYSDFEVRFEEMVRSALPAQANNQIASPLYERPVTPEFLDNVRAAQR